MRLFRAVSYAELQDILNTGVLRPGPPSFQGKWFALTVADAAEWGRRLVRLGNPPFLLIEAEIGDADSAALFRSDFWDRIGPACYADESQLGLVRFVKEITDVPTQWPPPPADPG